MICDRIQVLIVFQCRSRALVCVSCVFWGCVRCWSMVSRPGANRRFDVALYVFCECSVNAIAIAIAIAIANANANADANANAIAS